MWGAGTLIAMLVKSALPCMLFFHLIYYNDRVFTTPKQTCAKR